MLVYSSISHQRTASCIARCTIYSETLEDWTKHQLLTDLGNPHPIPSHLALSWSFLEITCCKSSLLCTFKHQLNNSFSFIKYFCFERQSECKNVNVNKPLAWILFIAEVSMFYYYIHFRE